MEKAAEETMKVAKIRKAVGQLFRFLRTQKGLTQKQVAERMGCSRPNVAQFEIDGVDGIGAIFSFCAALEISVRDFFVILPSMIDSGGEFRIHPRKMLEILKKDIETVCEKRGVKTEVTIVTKILSE